MYYTNEKAPTLVATYNTSLGSSVQITLNSGTTYLKVTAIDKGIFLKWDGTASSSSFDEFIGAGETHIYVRPDNTSTVDLIQESATAKVVVLEK